MQFVPEGKRKTHRRLISAFPVFLFRDPLKLRHPHYCCPGKVRLRANKKKDQTWCPTFLLLWLFFRKIKYSNGRFDDFSIGEFCFDLWSRIWNKKVTEWNSSWEKLKSTVTFPKCLFKYGHVFIICRPKQKCEELKQRGIQEFHRLLSTSSTNLYVFGGFFKQLLYESFLYFKIFFSCFLINCCEFLFNQCVFYKNLFFKAFLALFFQTNQFIPFINFQFFQSLLLF